MEYMHKLPFVLSVSMAIVIGGISYNYHVSQQDIYVRMAIAMIIFFGIGVFIRNTITKISGEVARKKQKEEQEELARNEETQPPSTLDLKVDENYDEDFSPLAVKEILRSGKEES